MTFPRLRDLSGGDPDLVLRALSRSDSGLLQASGGSLRRLRAPPPRMTDVRRADIRDRTVLVCGFDRRGTSLDDLIDFFEGGFPSVCNVRMRKRMAANKEGTYCSEVWG